MDSQANRTDDRQQVAKSDFDRGGARSATGNASAGKSATVIGSLIASLREDRTVPALAREAIKDIRSSVHEVFFGQREQGGELGAPLNPLASEIANDNSATVHGPPSPSPGDIAYGRVSMGQAQNEQQRDNGQVLQQKGGWIDRVLKGREEKQSGDGYDRQKERIKPQEEKDKQKEQERGRGGRC